MSRCRDSLDHPGSVAGSAAVVGGCTCELPFEDAEQNSAIMSEFIDDSVE
jgi:hypothetical protein